METFNQSFLQKYQETTGKIVCNADDFFALHKKLGGKTIYSFLDITEIEVDRAFLHSCSTDEKCFKREFSGLEFDTFKVAEFVFRNDDNFNKYLNFLEYRKIEAILYDTNFDDTRKAIEICKALHCTQSEATRLVSVKLTNNNTPVIPTQFPEETEIPLGKGLGVSNETKIYSELLSELNIRTINAEIPHDALFGYTSYACDTHRKFSPLIIDYLLARWREVQERNGCEIDFLLKEYDDFLGLNIDNMLFEFGTLPSAHTLPSANSFWKSRYIKEVEPVLTGCEMVYNSTCEERMNYIIIQKVEENLQHTRDVSNIIMEIIISFTDDKMMADKILGERGYEDDLLYAARIYVLTKRLRSIYAYICTVSAEIRALYARMHRVAQELSARNEKLKRIKDEYEATFQGESMLYELKVSPFSRQQKDNRKDEIETQAILLNNLKRYFRMR